MRVLELVWGAVLWHVERLTILVCEACLLLEQMLAYQVLDTSWWREQQLRIVIRLLRHFIDFLSLYFNLVSYLTSKECFCKCLIQVLISSYMRACLIYIIKFN